MSLVPDNPEEFVESDHNDLRRANLEATIYDRKRATDAVNQRILEEDNAYLYESFETPLVPFAEELDDYVEPTPLIENILGSEGYMAGLTAQRGAGKTTAVADLARCLINGEPFLGQNTQKLDGNFIVWDYELARPQAVHQYRNPMKSRKFLREDLLQGFRRTNLFDSNLFDKNVERLKQAEAQVLAIDSYSMHIAACGLHTQSLELKQYFGLLQEMVGQAGIDAVLMISHMGKDQSVGNKGSIDFEEVMRTLIYLTKRKTDVRWKFEKNAVSKGLWVGKEFGVTMDDEGHLVGAESIEVHITKEQEESQKFFELKTKILEVLPKPANGEVLPKAPVSRNTVMALLREKGYKFTTSDVTPALKALELDKALLDSELMGGYVVNPQATFLINY